MGRGAQSVIVVDVMGGDNAPDVVLKGCKAALEDDPSLSLILCGPAEVVEPFALAYDRCKAHPTTQIIAMDEHPAQAVRKKKDSSIVVGCRLVKEGQAGGFFSAGSTGACLAAATMIIGRLKGVLRPALVVVIPTPVRPVVLADVGANADCKPSYLVQFAKMARVFSHKIVGVAEPTVALLNIGEEESKGSMFAQEAHNLMRSEVPHFVGNGEGRDIPAGAFDVCVTDGFTGNVVLKSIEGTVKLLFGELKSAFTSSTPAKLSGLVMQKQFRDLRNRLDPDTYGGSLLLGLKEVCIVGHGSSSARAVKNGILTAARSARMGLAEAIEETLAPDVSCNVQSPNMMKEALRP